MAPRGFATLKICKSGVLDPSRKSGAQLKGRNGIASPTQQLELSPWEAGLEIKSLNVEFGRERDNEVLISKVPGS